MKRSPYLIVISLVLVLLPWIALHISAQTPTGGDFSYGETVQGGFESDASQTWFFEADERDLFSLRLQRISGQFSPSMIIIDPNGNTIVPTQEIAQDADRTWLLFVEGTIKGSYEIQVSGDANTDVDNPNEYSLTLTYEGRRLADLAQGLDPLPERTADDMPNLQDGSSRTNAMNVPFYGNATISQPDERTQRNRWVLEGDEFSIDMDNANPLDRGLESLSIVDEGVGFTMLSGEEFFSTESISSLTYTQSILSITLQDGRTIETDFFRIRQIQVVDDLLVVTTTTDQRILLEGQDFSFRRRGGIDGEGPNVEPVNLFTVNQYELNTDLSLWHTLYYNVSNPEIRILYGTDTRFISQYLDAGVYQRGNQESPDLNDESLDTRYLDFNVQNPNNNTAPNLDFLIDPFAMGDIIVHTDTTTIAPLDGREIVEVTNTLARVLVENRGILFTRHDNSYRLSLPDRTDIQTPVFVPNNGSAQPSTVDYRPLNANNLGNMLYDYHPQVNWDEFLLPVNPVNGNFFYSVNDIAVPSQDLALDWTRYYNSLASASTTPDYMLDSKHDYLFGQMGANWRHSYQYELDIRYAPLNEVWLRLPDGSQHIFRTDDALTNFSPIFRSRTMMSWEVQRLDGITGRWIARNGDGEIYEFDRAGRLEHIRDLAGNVLLFSPAPRNLVEQYEQEGGFFVTETYGRRIEVYTDSNNQVNLVRQQFEYQYEHDSSGHLTHIQYPSVLQNLPNGANNYSYDSSGQLTEIRDRRSPYHSEMGINYNDDGQVNDWQINLDERGGNPAIITQMSYETGMTRTTILHETIQQSRITSFDSDQRIIEYTLTDGGINNRTQAFEYDAQTGRLYQFRQINGARYTYEYDERGYLTRLSSPSTRDYGFEYRTGFDGISRWITRIQYPDNSETRYSYDEATNQILALSQPLDDSRRLETRYEYDDNGRILRTFDPDPADEASAFVTEYSYDNFGYPIQIQTYSEAQPEIRQTLQMSFDIAGRLVDIVDWRGQPISIEWDNQRNLMTAYTYGDIARLVNRVEFQYDDYGNLTERRSQDLSETFTYNGLNLLASSSDGMGRVSDYHYDLFGNLIEETIPAGTGDSASDVQIFSYRYNGINELTDYILPGNERYTISYNIEGTGVPTSFMVQAPDEQSVTYVYNVDNLLTQVLKSNVSGNQSYQYLFAYDPIGNLISMQETHGAGRNFLVSYNEARLPISTQIGSITTTYEYNHAGELSRVLNPEGAETSYAYDTWGNINQVILPDNDGDTSNSAPTYRYQYDENDNLITFIDALENTTTFTYDELNRLISSNDPLGFPTEYQYDQRDNVVSITYPNGSIISAEYNNANLMTKWVDPTGREINYEYDASNRLIQSTGRNSVISTFTYDTIGNLVAQSVTDSRETIYSYDNSNRLISETNALGQTTAYNYTDLERVSQIVDSLGNIERYTWTGAGRLNIYTNQAGQEFDYSTDPLGRLQQMNTPGQLERFVMSYSDSGLIENIRHNIENLNEDYVFSYYPNGLLATAQTPDMTGQWEFTYDVMQNLTGMTSPVGDTTGYEYDALGRVIQRTLPDGAREEWAYDNVGNVTIYVAPNGMVSTFQYDSNNRVRIRTDEGDGISRQYSYNYSYTAPQLVIVDDNNNETRYFYDQFGNVNRIERTSMSDDNSLAISTSYDYDRVDNLLGITFPAIDTQGTQPAMRFSYNALNQLTRYIDASGGSWAYGYDTIGNVNQVNDPLGNVTTYEYDNNNRVTRIRYNNGAWAEFRYNVRANTLSAPENRTQSQENRSPILYSFDFNDRLINIEHSPNSQIDFERDDLGRVINMQTANNDQIRFDYNYQNQITSINAPEGNITRQYDEVGNLISSTGIGQDISLQYTDFGYLSRFEQGSLILNYEWDTLGNLLVTDSSQSGTTRYEYDPLYRLISIQANNETVNFERNDAGWHTQMNYGTGLISSVTYTPSGRIANLIYNANGNAYIFSYQYDSAGNLIRANRSDNNASGLVTRDTLYTYGRNNELIGERWLNDNNEVVYAVIYSYDLAGNVIQSVTYNTDSNPIRTIYLYNRNNQLTEQLRGVPADIFDRYTGDVVNPDAGEQAQTRLQYEYDNAGNLTVFTHPQGELTYRYDSWNRLTAVSGQNEDGNAVATTMQYNSLGQISQMEINGNRYAMLYDHNSLQSIRNEAENSVETYHYSPDGMLLWREANGSIQYPVVDALDNIRLWINADGLSSDGTLGVSVNGFGQIISPYGDQSGLAINDTPQLIYGGQVYEPSSGLILMGVRAYSPAIGRFIQRDPVRHDPQSSLYTYVQNRPTYSVDFSGMIAEIGFIESQSVLYPENNFSNTVQALGNTPDDATGRTMQVQALENTRLLALAESLRQNFNQESLTIDSSLCIRSFGGRYHNSTAFSWLPNVQLSGQSNAWVPDNMPDPARIPSRNLILNIVNRYKSTVFNNTGTFSGARCNFNVEQPSTGFMNPFASIRTHSLHDTLLSTGSMVATFGQESSLLFSPETSIPSFPNVSAEPTIQGSPLSITLPESLHNMQMDSFELVQSALLPLYDSTIGLTDADNDPLSGFAFDIYIRNP